MSNKKQTTNKQRIPKVRNPYSPRYDGCDISFKQPSLTKQSHKDECDVNFIMQRMEKTGIVSHLNHAEPNYGFAPAIDYHEALNIVLESRQNFDELPAEIRAKFGSDLSEFLTYIENPENAPELARMGLLTEEATHALLDPSEPSETHTERLTTSDTGEGQPDG